MTLDFQMPRHLESLAAEAEQMALAAAAQRTFPEDGWVVGYEPAFTRALGARGWIGMTWPAEMGGGGRPALERFVVYEQLIRHGAPMAAGWFADRQIGPTLLQFGSREQQRRWLPEIVQGRAMWCIGLSEPDAGSDLASLRTSAVRDGPDWIVSGSKVLKRPGIGDCFTP